MTPNPDTCHCPGGCGRRHNPNRVACIDCWKRLPLPLRNAIVAGRRNAARRAAPEHQRALDAAFAWYRNPSQVGR